MKKGEESQQEIQQGRGEIAIDLVDLLSFIISKIYVIVFFILVFALTTYIAMEAFIVPEYTSTTKMYVISKQDSNANVTYSDLQTGTQLTKDYQQFVVSKPVLEDVVSKLNLNINADELAEMVSVDTPIDTRILSVSVTYEDPVMAKEIVDELGIAASDQIIRIIENDSVNIFEEGNIPTSPSTPKTKRNVIIGAGAGMILALSILTIRYLIRQRKKA
ncbi:MAG: YveK family protein [Suipraeoptans sp.]